MTGTNLTLSEGGRSASQSVRARDTLVRLLRLALDRGDLVAVILLQQRIRALAS